MEKEQNSIEVYQLRICLLGISPSIWRRIHIRSDSTIADLHYTIQISMGWTDQHLNQFTIYGKEYGVYHDGGIEFPDDPKKTRLDQFNFRLRNRFRYEYNFHDSWKHEIRLEKQIDFESGETYPVCISGAGGTPPEDCGGPWAFMKLKQKYAQWYLINRIMEIIRESEEYLDMEEIYNLKFWMDINRFDRQVVNRKLNHYVHYGLDPKHWSEEMELCI